MGNGCKFTGTLDELGDLGGSEGGTDGDDHEKEKAGMVRHVKTRDETENGYRNEVVGEAP